jgi:hypothetical protein
MQKETIYTLPIINRTSQSNFVVRLKKLFGIRTKLTYEERVIWFIQNHYETGMEYSLMLENMKNENLDKVEWYDEIVKIPKYIDEL